MRIAFLGGFAFRPKGTIQGRAYPIAVELVHRGHEVSIFLPPYDNLADSGRHWIQEGVQIRNAKAGKGIAGYPPLLTRLILEVQAYQPDLLHVFKPKGFAGAAATYLQAKGMRNVVLDCDDWEGWGGFNDIKIYPWILKEYIDRQERWMMRTTPAVTVASRALFDRVVQVRGTSRGVYYVPNCGGSRASVKVQEEVRLRAQADARKKLGLPDGLIVFYNGHFEPTDDVMLFSRIAAPVAERNAATILFVGDGPDLPKVKQFFSERPNARALFLPRLPYESFIEAIWASDVTAFPYPDNPIHRSKCSLRVIDYMALGKPVITSAVGQNKEYIVDDESGILVPEENENLFAAKLELLLRDPELRARLGRNAERRIREHFRWDGGPLQQCRAAYEHATATHQTQSPGKPSDVNEQNSFFRAAS
jgi:glycosyltransferase involved in cell wall biosynthesis